MENNNPFEDIREKILHGRDLDEFTQMGVANELLSICDAFDDYFGIVRNGRDDYPYYLPKSKVIDPLTYGSGQSERLKISVSKIITLLNRVKEPLQAIREKLTKDNTFYLNLSSTIVSIVLRVPVSSINSYQKPSSYDYSRYSVISGVDTELQGIVLESYKVFNAVKDYDMTAECRDYYESNKATLYSIISSIDQVSNTASKKNSIPSKSSSGCMVAVVVISSSLIACLCCIVMVLL